MKLRTTNVPLWTSTRTVQQYNIASDQKMQIKQVTPDLIFAFSLFKTVAVYYQHLYH